MNRAPTYAEDDLPASAQTLTAFLAQVIAEAKARDDFDGTLLTILANHIVKEDPAGDAVEFSAARIEALAEARASAPKKEHSTGGDHT